MRNLRVKSKVVLFFFSFLFFTFPSKASAQDLSNSSITIVNPVRISTYTKDPALSLRKEYEEIEKRAFPATWLFTYDAITNEFLMREVSSMDNNQEFGIFLEVTENFSKASNVTYNKTNSWHHANALFLSGYKQEDRKKLIDKVFSEFKDKFGYYPKSVGGWWVDSFSLSYMKEKYGITGVLGISDQFDLDNYQVWGTPFSIPFYPSKIHAGMPGDNSNKLDIVTFRWAARDPLNGYISPSDKQASPVRDLSNGASLYSVQDYLGLGLSNDYFEKLVELYSVKKEYNEFGHITIGLEADYSSDIYEAIFAKRLDIVKKFEERGVSVVNMEDFSDWYQKEFPKDTPPHLVETDDLLGQPKKVMWYQNNLYRIGLIYDYNSKKLKVVDLRYYLNSLQEPFYLSPNKQFNLSINLPYVIDYVNDRDSVREDYVGSFEGISRRGYDFELKFEKAFISLGGQQILSSGINIPQSIDPPKELVFSDFSFRIPFSIKSRIPNIYPIIILGTIVVGLVVFNKRKYLGYHYKTVLVIIIVLMGSYILVQANTKYYISQSEADALRILRRLPKGRVLAYDRDCIRCKFETTYKPAAAGGVKNYIEPWSWKETLIDYSFSIAKTSKDARKILEDHDIDYVYLVKYEDYVEHLPYLPQDLGLSKIYENANTEIWQAN